MVNSRTKVQNPGHLRTFQDISRNSRTSRTSIVLLQKLWLRKLNWDDDLPTDLTHEWNEFCSKLSFLSQISIPRRIDRGADFCQIKIHGFSDAFSVAYAASVYSRIISPSGSISVKLLMAKTKVPPLKTVSIPRLELCASTLLAKLVSYVIDSLHLKDIPVFCWTDSSVVLGWLQQQPVTWTVFVANRVSAIQTTLPTAIWNHVQSKDNPADCASRGMSADKLASFSLWWNGPEWLSDHSDTWPQRNFKIIDPVLEKRISSHSTEIKDREDWHSSFLKLYSSWARLLRITAYALRAIQHFKTRAVFSKALTANEISDSAVFWIRYIQNTFFFS
ncbi:uncharacterized protein LOC122503291 [Leptopilina heterotoma]|uniref:uncharacterized protein LOC122503291 n=1 Tax=Leptopilina heterotoma TaxID=63436 RepID=UPI001CA7D6B2|nr:uncharacterized protein LOC122503291 [Leptopilina heterotoma]